jgi:hypothetical protein
MNEQARLQGIVEKISQRYGKVIDLERSPMVMIEVLRNFGHVLDDDGGGGSGGGGGVSTIAVGITPPTSGEQVGLVDVMKVLLSLQREVKGVRARLDQIGK